MKYREKPNATSGYVAVGNAYPDALAVSPLAARVGAPVFLTPEAPFEPPASTLAYIKSKNYQTLKIAGGVAVIPETTEIRLTTVLPY
jgi:hypothetical protein